MLISVANIRLFRTTLIISLPPGFKSALRSFKFAQARMRWFLVDPITRSLTVQIISAAFSRCFPVFALNYDLLRRRYDLWQTEARLGPLWLTAFELFPPSQPNIVTIVHPVAISPDVIIQG
jgi:hypothetical protein